MIYYIQPPQYCSQPIEQQIFIVAKDNGGLIWGVDICDSYRNINQQLAWLKKISKYKKYCPLTPTP